MDITSCISLRRSHQNRTAPVVPGGLVLTLGCCSCWSVISNPTLVRLNIFAKGFKQETSCWVRLAWVSTIRTKESKSKEWGNIFLIVKMQDTDRGWEGGRIACYVTPNLSHDCCGRRQRGRGQFKRWGKRVLDEIEVPHISWQDEFYRRYPSWVRCIIEQQHIGQIIDYLHLSGREDVRPTWSSSCSPVGSDKSENLEYIAYGLHLYYTDLSQHVTTGCQDLDYYSAGRDQSEVFGSEHVSPLYYWHLCITIVVRLGRLICPYIFKVRHLVVVSRGYVLSATS